MLPGGRYVFASPRRTCILGLIGASQAIERLAEELLHRSVSPFAYVLTYRFSQDHLELLFNKIRQRLGWNGNPNVVQFNTAIKSILVSSSVVPSAIGNCREFEENSLVLPLQCPHRNATQHPLPLTHLVIDERDLYAVGTFVADCVDYIAGYVARQGAQLLKCSKCLATLFAELPNTHVATLTQMKDRGGLCYPSGCLLLVCRVTETAPSSVTRGFTQAPSTPHLQHHISHVRQRILCSSHLKREIFYSFSAHFFDFDPTSGI